MAAGTSSSPAIATRRTKLTDREAEALGAEDADRYYRNGLMLQAQPTNTTTEDPFIDPPFQNLLAKPANDMAAKVMVRI